MNRVLDYTAFAREAKKHELDVLKMDILYPVQDTRCWTAIINPNRDNIVVTLNVNRYNIKNAYYDIQSSEKNLANIYIADIFEVIESLLSDSNSVYINYEGGQD